MADHRHRCDHRAAAPGPGRLGRGRPAGDPRVLGRPAAREAASLDGLDELTPREREVVALIATGLSNDEISRKIYVSPSTVKTHAARAMTKLRARDRAQLVVFAYQAGLVRPGWAD